MNLKSAADRINPPDKYAAVPFVTSVTNKLFRGDGIRFFPEFQNFIKSRRNHVSDMNVTVSGRRITRRNAERHESSGLRLFRSCTQRFLKQAGRMNHMIGRQ